MSFNLLKSQVAGAMTSYAGIAPRQAAYLVDHVGKISVGNLRETLHLPGTDAVTIITDQAPKKTLRPPGVAGRCDVTSKTVLNFGFGPNKRTIIVLGLSEAMTGAPAQFSFEESKDGLFVYCTPAASPDTGFHPRNYTLEGNQDTPPPLGGPGGPEAEPDRKLTAEDAEGNQDTPPPDS